MSRGKVSTGKAIACRLPIKDDAVFRAKAKENGLSPGVYLRQIALTHAQSGL